MSVILYTPRIHDYQTPHEPDEVDYGWYFAGRRAGCVEGSWYRFVDPREHLKGYKIADYLKFVPAGGVIEHVPTIYEALKVKLVKGLFE
jgi:hypothetical protein